MSLYPIYRIAFDRSKNTRDHHGTGRRAIEMMGAFIGISMSNATAIYQFYLLGFHNSRSFVYCSIGNGVQSSVVMSPRETREQTVDYD